MRLKVLLHRLDVHLHNCASIDATFFHFRKSSHDGIGHELRAEFPQDFSVHRGHFRDAKFRRKLCQHLSELRRPFRKVPVTEAVKALFYAPFVCCSHDENDTFNYANQAALNLWEFEWDDFIGMPSTKSADGEDEEIQKERRQLLDDALEKGVVYNYNGVRKSKNVKCDISELRWI